MTNLAPLPSWAENGDLNVVVETPRGTRGKFKCDASLQAFRLSHSLMRGIVYPFDFGFIPSTAAEDGDPLDALIMHDVAMPVGLVLCCKPIGVVEVEQHEPRQRLRNDRIRVVPSASQQSQAFADARDLPDGAKREIENFFAASVASQDKSFVSAAGADPPRR